MQKLTVYFKNEIYLRKLLRNKFRIDILRYIFFLFFFLNIIESKAQSDVNIGLQVYQGAILPHSNTISHLITDKPKGFLLTIDNTKPTDAKWQKEYNYPDVGISLHSQFNQNKELGDLYGLYAHYNFYFFQRYLQLRIAQGFSYATNTYDKETNARNVAYGSKVMPSTYFMLGFDKKNLIDRFGINAGVMLVHHSNGSLKAPNISTNTLSFNLGVNYSFDSDHFNFLKSTSNTSYPNSNQWKFNGVFRTGINETYIVGMGQKMFYHLSAFAEKPLNEVGGVQVGTELFLSNSLKELIPFLAVSFPEKNIEKDAEWKRLGLFVGYEWYLNSVSLEAQFGYYLIDEYKEDGSLYQRLGMRYYLNDNIFTTMSLKTHMAKAEAFEIGVGYKL